jgi:hypothetical protein
MDALERFFGLRDEIGHPEVRSNTIQLKTETGTRVGQESVAVEYKEPERTIISDCWATVPGNVR